MGEVKNSKMESLEDKRSQYLFWIATICISFMTGIIILFSVFNFFNTNKELERLKSLEKNVNNKLKSQIKRIDIALKSIEGKPDLRLYTTKNQPLNNNTIKANFGEMNGKKNTVFLAYCRQ